MVLVARQNDNAEAEVTSWSDGELASLYFTTYIIYICLTPTSVIFRCKSQPYEANAFRAVVVHHIYLAKLVNDGNTLNRTATDGKSKVTVAS